MHISLQQLDPKDPAFQQAYLWRCDPKTRINSLRTKALSWDTFFSEFATKCGQTTSIPSQWILKGKQRVGVLYFDPWHKEGILEISLFLDPLHQNQGIAPKAIRYALQLAFEKNCEEIIALIKKSNKGAQKAFTNAGFTLFGPIETCKHKKKHKLLKFRYLKENFKPSVFIIAEAGSNFHVGSVEEDLKQAKTLILEAYKAGADAVKFQLYDGKSVYATNAGSPSYLKGDIHKIFNEFALPQSIIEKLYHYANYLGIEFMCSSFSEEHFKCINPYVQRHKIASYEIRHLRLLELAARSGKPLILSTGASNEEDIEWALGVFKKAGGQQITLLHCNAQYPADPASLNLNCIKAMQERFKVPCGFSDHSADPLYAPLCAVALGSKVIEKHFTISRDLPGPDHFFALEGAELASMVKGIRTAEKMLGLAKKEVFPQEEELAHFTRRGLQALKQIHPGEQFIEGENVGILRPGNQQPGLHPKYLDRLLKTRAQHQIEEGCGIGFNDVLWK